MENIIQIPKAGREIRAISLNFAVHGAVYEDFILSSIVPPPNEKNKFTSFQERLLFYSNLFV